MKRGTQSIFPFFSGGFCIPIFRCKPAGCFDWKAANFVVIVGIGGQNKWGHPRYSLFFSGMGHAVGSPKIGRCHMSYIFAREAITEPASSQFKINRPNPLLFKILSPYRFRLIFSMVLGTWYLPVRSPSKM